MNDTQTVTNWISRLADGDGRALEMVFEKYFNRLIKLALHKMHGLNTVPYSPEDVVNSVVRSLWNGVQKNKIEITTEDNLWGCLYQITTRKVCAERRRAFSQKRGENRMVISGDQVNEETEESFFNSIVGKEPSPEMAVEMAEGADELLSLFDKLPTHKELIILKLQGFSNHEIANKLGICDNSVRRYTKDIQTKMMFYKTMEYMIENAFAGMSLFKIAEELEIPEENIRAILEKMIELWSQEDPSRQKALIEEKFFGPKDSAHSLLTPQLERSLPKIADQWMSLVRTQWKDSLLKLMKPFLK